MRQQRLQEKVEMLRDAVQSKRRALGLALLGEPSDVRRQRADLARAEQGLSDAEAMLLAWADFDQSLRTQYRPAPAGPYVPPTHINDYQSAVSQFIADYDMCRDPKALLPRAEELRKLAKSCGQIAVTDLQRRFNGLGALPELHARL